MLQVLAMVPELAVHEAIVPEEGSLGLNTSKGAASRPHNLVVLVSAMAPKEMYKMRQEIQRRGTDTNNRRRLDFNQADVEFTPKFIES